MKNGAIAKQNRCLLVVEDDISVRRVLRMVLGTAGYDVAEADSGQEALRRLEEGGLSGVLLDMGLSDSRSADVLEWLHQHGEQPPWLVVSAMDLGELRHTDASIRGSRFIAKPFDPWMLLDRVQALVDNNWAGERSQGR